MPVVPISYTVRFLEYSVVKILYINSSAETGRTCSGKKPPTGLLLGVSGGNGNISDPGTRVAANEPATGKGVDVKIET
jgi:hypothetical protein